MCLTNWIERLYYQCWTTNNKTEHFRLEIIGGKVLNIQYCQAMFEPQNGLINYILQSAKSLNNDPKTVIEKWRCLVVSQPYKIFFLSERPKPLKSGIGNAVSREMDANNVYNVEPGNIIFSLR